VRLVVAEFIKASVEWIPPLASLAVSHLLPKPLDLWLCGR
jgi:hypothetical protein